MKKLNEVLGESVNFHKLRVALLYKWSVVNNSVFESANAGILNNYNSGSSVGLMRPKLVFTIYIYIYILTFYI